MQELVGVAGNATCLINDEGQRKELAKRLKLDELGDEAWAIPRVQALHENDRSKFDKLRQADLAWIPTWKCPVDMFLWLDEPARLDAQAIRGTVKRQRQRQRQRQRRRSEVLTWFGKQKACLVGIGARGGAHHWAREIAAPGHDVRLLPPAWVKPWV